MSLKERFEQGILSGRNNVIGTHFSSRYSNPFHDSRLDGVRRITDSGLDQITHQGKKVFRVEHHSSPLGLNISVEHTTRGKIQYSCPRGDRNSLWVSVEPPYSGGGERAANIYDYTDNRQAANNRFIDWLAEVAPENAKEILSIIERLETPLSEPLYKACVREI